MRAYLEKKNPPLPAELKAAGSSKKGIEKAVRDLLSFVILVVTPIERPLAE